MSDCSKHKKEVAGISDMKELAEMIGGLHYEALSKLMFHFRDKILQDAQKDKRGGRKRLADHLFNAHTNINETANSF